MKLKFALRTKIVNDFGDAPSTSTELAVANPEQALLSESQALIEPQVDWKEECKLYEKRLMESFEIRDAMKKELKELKVLKRKNAELEKENRAYKRSLDAIARKRVEDRKAIEKWKKKIAERTGDAALSSDGLATTSDTKPADSQKPSKKRRKTLVEDDSDSSDVQVTYPEPTREQDFRSDNLLSTFQSETNNDSADIFVGGRHPSEEPTQYEFAKPKLLSSIQTSLSLQDPDSPAKKQESWNIEARGIPNLISSPVFSHSSQLEERTKIKAENSDNFIQPKNENEEPSNDEFQVLAAAPTHSVQESSLNDLRATGFVKYSQDAEEPHKITSSPPLARYTGVPETTSSGESTSSSSPLREVLDVTPTNTNDQLVPETPQTERRNSSKFPRVDFAEIDDDLRAPRPNGLAKPYLNGDGDSGSNKKRRGKSKSVLIHIPTPQSEGGAGSRTGIFNENDEVSKSKPRFMDKWLEGGNNGIVQDSNGQQSGSTITQGTPTKRTNNLGLLKARKAAFTLSVKELQSDEELLEL